MGNRAVGANCIGNAVCQNQLQPIDRGRAHQCVALIDQIKQRRRTSGSGCHRIRRTSKLASTLISCATGPLQLSFPQSSFRSRRPDPEARRAISLCGPARRAAARTAGHSGCTIQLACQRPRPHRRPMHSRTGMQWRLQGCRADQRQVDRLSGAACRLRGLRCMIKILLGMNPRFLRIVSNWSCNSGECSGGSA